MVDGDRLQDNQRVLLLPDRTRFTMGICPVVFSLVVDRGRSGSEGRGTRERRGEAEQYRGATTDLFATIKFAIDTACRACLPIFMYKLHTFQLDSFRSNCVCFTDRLLAWAEGQCWAIWPWRARLGARQTHGAQIAARLGAAQVSEESLLPDPMSFAFYVIY